MSQAIVNSFSALRTAALDPDVDTILLSEDITLETGGISLPKNKPSLVIDGFYPQDETGVMHTITDRNNNLQSDAIRVAAVSGSYHLTLKNCNFVGHNYYGAISSALSSLQRQTTLTLDNVTYSGPQAAYNRYGTVEFIGGDYKIGQYNGATTQQELVETNTMIVKGDVTVTHTSLANPCIWLTDSSPNFTITENSSLTVTSDNRELFYVDGGSPSVILENGSRLNSTTHWGMFYSAGMEASSVTIGENAEFVLTQTSPHAGVATMQCGGNLTVGKNSRFILIKPFTSSEYLLQFNASATAQFNDPLAVVFYNASSRIINWSVGTGNLIINAEMVNYWTTAAPLGTAGGFDNPPLYRWQKADESNAEITARLSTTTTTSVTTNLIVNTDAPIIPTTTSFNVQNARVMSFGRLPLSVNNPRETNTEVSGTTLPAAKIRVTVNSTQTEDFADSGGAYLVTLPNPLQKSDNVIVGANIDFKTVYKTIKALGIVRFLILPERLPFKSVALPVRKQLYGRKDPNWAIVIRDSRNNEGPWELYVHAPDPMKSGTAEIHDSLIFTEGGVPQTLELITTRICNKECNVLEYTDTTLLWSEIEGFLLKLVPNTPYTAGHYTAELNFTLIPQESE